MGASWQEANGKAVAATDKGTAFFILLVIGHVALIDEIVSASDRFDAVITAGGGVPLLALQKV